MASMPRTAPTSASAPCPRIRILEATWHRQGPHHDKGRHAPFPYALFKFSRSPRSYAHAAFNFGRYFVYNSLLQFYVEELGTSAVAPASTFWSGKYLIASASSVRAVCR